jgi:hypothetical protein
MTVVFDLDGCLIDSEELIRESYREAGAEPPADFFTLGHHGWITDDREGLHDRKNAAYLRRLRFPGANLLPPWGVAERLYSEGHVTAILTGAPTGTISLLPWHTSSWPFTVTLDGYSPAAKTAWMAAGTGGTYVDDQRYVTVPAGWRFVHYAGQGAAELYDQVIR